MPKMDFSNIEKYWHSLPKRLKKDQDQNIKLTNLGYSVIRFLGSMIKKEPEKIKEKIINELCRTKKY